MTTAEFIVETQWALIVLLALLTVTLAMVCSRSFRAAVLSRTWRIGPGGLTSELPPPNGEALQHATRTDGEVVEALGAGGDSASAEQVDITTFRRGVVEALMRDAARWGWYQAQLGFRRPPDCHVDWEAEGGPRLRNDTAAANDRMSDYDGSLRERYGGSRR